MKDFLDNNYRDGVFNYKQPCQHEISEFKLQKPDFTHSDFCKKCGEWMPDEKTIKISSVYDDNF